MISGQPRAELPAPHVDRLVCWLNHDEWWISWPRHCVVTFARKSCMYHWRLLYPSSRVAVS